MIRCERCGQYFMSSDEYNDHRNVCSPETRSYYSKICPYCKGTGETVGGLLYGGGTCPYCHGSGREEY